MEKTKFYVRIHCKLTDEVFEVLVPRGDIKLGLRHVLKRYPDYEGELTVSTMLTKPQPDDNNERYRITTLRELEPNTYFKVVRQDGTVGKNVFVKGEFDRGMQKYDCPYFHDFCSSRQFKSNQRVCIDFTF